MAACSIDNLLDEVYEKTNSWDPKEIAAYFDYDILYNPIGPDTLGTRITNNRCTTIILDTNLSPTESILVPLHEIKHCLTDKGVGTPFLRRHSSGVTVTKREYEANYFAMHAMIRDHSFDLNGLSSYQICQYFGLDDWWARFI